MRRVLLLCLSASLALAGSAPPSHAAVPVLIIEGRGFGHGVGMAQDGAYWMGRAGANVNQILGHFYPGTSLGKASGSVRVAVLTSAGRDAVLAFPNGGEVRDARSGAQSPGFPVRVAPGGQVRVRFDGSRYVAEPISGAEVNGAASAQAGASSSSATSGDDQTPATTPVQTGAAQEPPPSDTTTTSTSLPPIIGGPPPELTTTTTTPAPPPGETPPPPPPGGPTAATSGRPLWGVPADDGTVAVPARSHRYRGVVEALGGAGGLRLVNEVDVEQYLRGMGEVRDPRWPPASLRAQAVAARTYAIRAMAVAGELCDTQRCQVYLGADAEYGAMNKAVADTARQVVVFGKGLASTVYSANGGGVTASREEGFGTSGGGYPYLRPGPYQTQNPLPWTVKVALTDLAARFGYPGQLTAARVGQTGPSGRATAVVLDGSAGSRTVTGLAFDAGLGLKSTLFTLATGTSDVAPPAPPPGDGIQALPDDLGPVVGAAPTGATAAIPALPGGPKALTSAGDDDVPVPLTGLALLLNVVVAAAIARRVLRYEWPSPDNLLDF